MLLEVSPTFIDIKEWYVALDYRSHYRVRGFSHHENERCEDDILALMFIFISSFMSLCVSLISLLH